MAKRVIVARFQADTKHFNASMRKAEEALRGLGFAAVKAGPPLSMKEKRMRALVRQTNAATHSFVRFRRSMARVNAGLLGTGGLIYLVTRRFTQGVKEAAAFDRMVTKASKTSRTFGDQLNILRQSLENTGIQAGFARNQIGGIAGTAGQIGIKGSRAIATFSEQIAKLSRTSNLSTDEAAAYTARILQLTNTDVLNGVKTLTAAITHLGNNSNATEKQIAEVAVKLAPLGRAFKISAVDVAAFGASMASAGVQAQAGATAFLRLFQYFTQFKADNAVAQLSLIARVAKKSVGEVKQLIDNDLASLAADFLGGLGELGPGEQGQVLERIGFTALRERKVFLAQANQLPREKLDLARSQIGSPNATENEFAIQLAARSGRIALATNKLNTAFGRAGDALIDRFLPGLESVAEIMDRFSSFFTGRSTEIEAGLDRRASQNIVQGAGAHPLFGGTDTSAPAATLQSRDPFVQQLVSARAGGTFSDAENAQIQILGRINREIAKTEAASRRFFMDGLEDLREIQATTDPKEFQRLTEELVRQRHIQFGVDLERLQERRSNVRFGIYNDDGKLIEEGLRHLAARAVLETPAAGDPFGERAAAARLLEVAEREKNPNRIALADPGIASLLSPGGGARSLATALLGTTLHRQGRPQDEVSFQMGLRAILEEMDAARVAIRSSDDPAVERARLEELRQKKRDFVANRKLQREEGEAAAADKKKANAMQEALDQHYYDTAVGELELYHAEASDAQRKFFQRQAQIDEDQISALYAPDGKRREAMQKNIDLRQRELEADIAAYEEAERIKERASARSLLQAQRRAAHEQSVLQMMRNNASEQEIEYQQRRFEINMEADQLRYEMTKASTETQKALLEAAIARNRQAAEALKNPEQQRRKEIADAIIDPLADALRGKTTLKEAFDGLMLELAHSILEKRIVEPFKKNMEGLILTAMDALFGSAGGVNNQFSNIGSGGGGAGLVGSFFGSLLGFERGGKALRGGLALVGERGPEVVNMPTGSMVYPNGMMAGGGGRSVVNNFNIQSEDKTAIKRVMQEEMPQIIRNVEASLLNKSQGNSRFARAFGN